jgi:hypothetical protein
VAGDEFGSLTKEPPLATLDDTIRAVTPGMSYSNLLSHASRHTHKDAPGLIVQRYLLLASDNTITYDHFLSLAAVHPLNSSFIRKIMYFLWAYRDERIRRFVCEVIADASGRWRIGELLRKSNAKFFHRWLAASTAKKARSNYEFFLAETKIVDLKTRTVDLDLGDGWLEQAAIAASQHERDPLVREELLANPSNFLERRGWLGLLNTTSAAVPVSSPLLSIDTAPLEDSTIAAEPTLSPSGKAWDRSSPSTSGKATTVANIDLVARERANKSHYALEKTLADLVTGQKLTPKYNQNIDMYFASTGGSVLVEIKSCTDSNFHSQVRKGISQLFEYRFLYRSLFGSEPKLVLLVETAPPKKKRWLVDYASSLDVVLAWRQSTTGKVVSTCALPKMLIGIVTPITLQQFSL